MKEELYFIEKDKTNIVFHIPTSSFFRISQEFKIALERYLVGEYDEEYAEPIKSFFDVLNKREKKIVTKLNKAKRLSKLTVICTYACNLNCQYCFYKDRQDEYQYTQGMLQPEVLIETIHGLLEEYPEGIETIVFFGGEPLLNFEAIKKVVPQIIELYKEKNVAPADFGIITNGTIMNQEIIDFLNEYKVILTVSIDGTKEIHNEMRKFKLGNGSYEQIVENIHRLREKREFALYVEMTLNKKHILAYKPNEAIKWLKEIEQMGFDGIELGVVDHSKSDIAITEADKEIFKQMYSEMQEYLFENMFHENGMKCLSSIRILKRMQSKEYSIVPCGAGINSLVLDWNGIIAPCYLLIDKKAFSMGSIEEGFKENKRVEEFLASYEKKPLECENCWMRNICGVWCRLFSYNLRKKYDTISPQRCWLAEVTLETNIINLAKLQEKPMRYARYKKQMKKCYKLY